MLRWVVPLFLWGSALLGRHAQGLLYSRMATSYLILSSGTLTLSPCNGWI